jgi:hypothetical protein
MPDTLPGAMLDGVTSEGGWSNAYVKEPTAMLPAFSRAHATEWVSVSWPGPQTFDSVRAYFVADQSHVLPSRIAVSVWDGAAWAPAGNAKIASAAAAGGPTTVTFDRVTSSAVRLDLTSPAPGTDAGFLQIAELEVMGIPVTYNATASLASLEVNGAPVSGFDPTGLEYQVTVGELVERALPGFDVCGLGHQRGRAGELGRSPVPRAAGDDHVGGAAVASTPARLANDEARWDDDRQCRSLALDEVQSGLHGAIAECERRVAHGGQRRGTGSGIEDVVEPDRRHVLRNA